MSNGDQPQCPTGSCGYGALGGGSDCNGGDSSCANARLYVPPDLDGFFSGAETRNGYFSQGLQEVSLGLNDIFDELHDDPSGQKRPLSLLRTPRGIAVGYLRHDVKGEPDAKQVRADDPRVVQELRIVDEGEQNALCSGMRCGYKIVDGEVRCVASSVATCWPATFLAAEVCDYHPQNVKEKMSAIKDLVASIAHEANGRILTLLLTENGPMLAWAHGQPVSQSAA